MLLFCTRDLFSGFLENSGNSFSRLTFILLRINKITSMKHLIRTIAAVGLVGCGESQSPYRLQKHQISPLTKLLVRM